jgi:hypothetical protein
MSRCDEFIFIISFMIMGGADSTGLRWIGFRQALFFK